MRAPTFLLVSVGLVSSYGCAHTAPKAPHGDAPRTVATADDPIAKSLSLMQAADVARASGDRAAATRLYSEAVTLQPGNSQAWFGLGTSYLHQNDIELAVTALQEAVRRDPTLQKAWSNLALAHLQEFRIAAHNALSGTQVTQANRDALSSLLADADRTLGASSNSTSSGR